MKTIKVDGVDYAPVQPNGNRAVVVVDRGWIFAGDVSEANGRIKLTRAVMVFKWSAVGFNGMIANPKSEEVTIKPMTNDVDIPADAELFRVPVDDDWGM